MADWFFLFGFKGMGYAGTAGMVWGWIVSLHLLVCLIVSFSHLSFFQKIGMVFIQCVAMSMSELCSSMPTR